MTHQEPPCSLRISSKVNRRIRPISNNSHHQHQPIAQQEISATTILNHNNNKVPCQVTVVPILVRQKSSNLWLSKGSSKCQDILVYISKVNNSNLLINNNSSNSNSNSSNSNNNSSRSLDLVHHNNNSSHRISIILK